MTPISYQKKNDIHTEKKEGKKKNEINKPLQTVERARHVRLVALL
jgi:hypothetical protein